MTVMKRKESLQITRGNHFSRPKTYIWGMTANPILPQLTLSPFNRNIRSQTAPITTGMGMLLFLQQSCRAALQKASDLSKCLPPPQSVKSSQESRWKIFKGSKQAQLWHDYHTKKMMNVCSNAITLSVEIKYISYAGDAA